MEKLKILVMTMLPLLAGACRLNGGQPTPDPEPPEPIHIDTTYYRSFLRFEAPYPVEKTDILIYRPDGLMDLIDHIQAHGPTVELALTDDRPKTIAVAANARGTFNTAALNHFDSLNGIIIRLTDDSPDAPIMSGIYSITPGRDTVLKLSPLLCTVELAGVTNCFAGDVLAENPRVWLENVNCEAELFRERGFTVRDASSSKRQRLPYDIGLYTQYPGTKLYCYPNDLPNPATGNPATELVFQCEVEGKTHTIRYVLHPIPRGSTIPVEVLIR